MSNGTLAPTFATATIGYTASVANTVASVTLKPTSSASATIKVNGVATASGAASSALALNVGANTLSVVVTAQDGATSKTYTVAVTRAAAVACAVIPEETAGPYPADGSSASSHTYNVLALAGIVRQDIRNNSCAPLAGYAIYLWHCTREGAYSVYTESSVDANYLRGVQATDANGVATFTTIFPGCYAGRMPHMHFEVYPSVAKASTAGNKVKTSQLAFPTDICSTVYASASGYTNNLANFKSISFASDNVFSDGYSLEMTSLSGSVATGFVANVTVSIAV